MTRHGERERERQRDGHPEANRRRRPRGHSLLIAVVLGATSGCTSNASNAPDRAEPVPVSGQALALLLDAEIRVVFAQTGAELTQDEMLSFVTDKSFHAVIGPRDALDGRYHTIDMSEPAEWQAVNNLLYSVDMPDGQIEARRTPIALHAGDPGVHGTIEFSGAPESNQGVSCFYSVGFNGRYDLPELGEVDLNLGLTNRGLQGVELVEVAQ